MYLHMYVQHHIYICKYAHMHTIGTVHTMIKTLNKNTSIATVSIETWEWNKFLVS